jgi:hypothetical protein
MKPWNENGGRHKAEGARQKPTEVCFGNSAITHDDGKLPHLHCHALHRLPSAVRRKPLRNHSGNSNFPPEV